MLDDEGPWHAFRAGTQRVSGAMTRRLGSSSSPRVRGENSMRSSFRGCWRTAMANPKIRAPIPDGTGVTDFTMLRERPDSSSRGMERGVRGCHETCTLSPPKARSFGDDEARRSSSSRSW